MREGLKAVKSSACAILLLSISLFSLVQGQATYSIYYASSSAVLSYPSFFDGFLWTTTSRIDNSLRKYDLSSGILLQRVRLLNLDHSTDEAFNSFSYNDLIYVPSIGYQSVNTMLTIYNETTLAEVFQLDEPWSVMSGFIQTIYDPLHDRLLFGCDMQNNTYGFWAVDPTQSLNANAYYFINVGQATTNGGYEIQPVIFNNKVYAIMMDNGAGTNGIVNTEIMSSSDLVNWNTEYTASGYNHGNGAYFPHIAANNNYIVAGLLSSARSNDGKTTYRYVYKSTSGQWLEWNTRYAETNAEDHPMVQVFDDNSKFFIELCQRQESAITNQPQCYLFDASNGGAQFLFTISDNGFNDRWGAYARNTLYFQDGDSYGSYYTQILAFKTPLDIHPQPSPTPTKTPLDIHPQARSHSFGVDF